MGSPAYDKKNTKMIILDKLAACGNKQAYIKRLIRADLKRACPDIDEMIESSAKQGGE